ncbi:MAG TPA: ORF6N domain-containing protein [Spirochaetota bacterium]|nr:ORF6N domain-containing protein [Spirochaetota bacterium]
MTEIIPVESIKDRIFLLRGEKVMIDRDLAELYGVETKRLNEQVKRNINRFPSDFMFQLNDEERKELVAKCDRLKPLRHSASNPYAFTEHGAIMIATILNTPQADKMSVLVVRAFVKLREFVLPQAEIAKRIDDLEKKAGNHDKAIQQLIHAIRQLMMPEEKSKKKIGF